MRYHTRGNCEVSTVGLENLGSIWVVAFPGPEQDNVFFFSRGAKIKRVLPVLFCYLAADYRA